LPIQHDDDDDDDDDVGVFAVSRRTTQPIYYQWHIVIVETFGIVVTFRGMNDRITYAGGRGSHSEATFLTIKSPS
jgi:hypothetical protein